MIDDQSIVVNEGLVGIPVEETAQPDPTVET